MQPYLFPYIGYFQMIKAVDKFVFYDDVNFIKQGWVNRNKILINSKEHLFTVPLQKATSFSLIKDTLINHNLYGVWKKKLLRSIDQNYNKAPYFIEVNELLYHVLDSKCTTISQLAIESVKSVSNYLELDTNFLISSECFDNKDLERQERLIDICRRENASQYINAIGGQELYTKEDFKEKGVELCFIKPMPINYKQFNNEFVPWLSIIDVLMFNSIEEVSKMLGYYDLL